MNTPHLMRIPLALSAAVLAATAFAADPTDLPDETLRNYVAWHKMTPQPHSVSAEFSALCGMNPQSIAALKRTGPHYAHWINVYMNEAAQIHFESKPKIADPFPPGSIVVKEKLYPGSSAKGGVPEMIAVAGMVKHAPGYDSRAGDWEFFFYQKDGKIERGAQPKLAACADCHHEAPGDYVFGDFARPKAMP
jgi:hypothetical protein